MSNLKRKRRIKEYRYYSKKLKRLITVKEHNRKYWIENGNRWKRIDPFKYDFVTGKNEQNYAWLNELTEKEYHNILSEMKLRFFDNSNNNQDIELNKEINELINQYYWNGSPSFIKESKTCAQNEKKANVLISHKTPDFDAIIDRISFIKAYNSKSKHLHKKGDLRSDEYKNLIDRNNKTISILKKYKKEQNRRI